jgi:hypothetical protein
MKQTAVEWYSDKLLEILEDNVNLFTKEQTLANHYALKQAKEMEKQQIIDAYKDSTSQFSVDARIDYPKSAEQYYNEQFKNK